MADAPAPRTPSPGRRSRAPSRTATAASLDSSTVSTAPVPVTSRRNSSESDDAAQELLLNRREHAFQRMSLDLRALDYPEPCDGNLVCLICQCPFIRPVCLPCEHIFCDECIRHALDVQDSGRRSCPVCRQGVNRHKDIKPVPRVFTNMVDDLVCKCPNAYQGCTWTDKRGYVTDHVEKYCMYTMVECPAEGCNQGIPLKDVDQGCLHFTVTCEDCHVSLAKKDLEAHEQNHCPNSHIQCPQCHDPILRRHLKPHFERDCPLTPLPCPGAVYGCTFVGTRRRFDMHTTQCPIACMTPVLQAHEAKYKAQQTVQATMQRKLDILEAGFANLQSMIYDHPFSLSPGNPDDPFATTIGSSSSSSSYADGSSSAAAATYDPQVTHLLSLHGALQDELTRIRAALTESEGRTMLAVLNETGRLRDEMTRVNAVVNNINVHLRWLSACRLQAQNRVAGAGASGSGTGAGAGSRAAGVPGGSARRESEVGRQDTKL